MPSKLRLLIVEDDPTAVKVYEQQIKYFNQKNKIQISKDIRKSQAEGLEALKKEDYDAAIIDIKLSSITTRETGNEIIRKIRADLRFPVRVYTAFDDMDDDLKEESEFYRVYKKSGEGAKSVQEIFTELVDIYKTGITNILGKRGTVEGYLKDIFWKHLSDSFRGWIDEAKVQKNIEKVLLRYTLAHIQEYLDKDEAGEFDMYHPAEVYIAKPVNKNIHTGLILKKDKDNQYFIVLTPLCDLANKSTKKVVLALIEEHNMQYVSDLKKKILNGGKGSIRARTALKDLLRNKHSLKYHYLPLVNGVGGFVNFQKIASLETSEIKANFSHVATVTDKFCKDIIARFSHYYARQGQPNFNYDNLYESMIK
jgi:CheY-like chemotaxis protein